jgi:anthranilate phosphoribosyltransferase
LTEPSIVSQPNHSSSHADPPAPAWFANTLTALLERRELTDVQMRAALTSMMQGQCGDAEAAAFLVALRMKGETAGEIAASAQVLREHMLRWDPGPEPILDTCGTGGDSSGTFNISTATAFVVAACGVRVVKHGNRAVSSRSGSADVLAALGVALEADALAARRRLDRCGLAFCFAPHFHPALRHVAAVRRRLGVGTLFNCLGPLANPAGAAYQLLGVGRPALLDLMAGALVQLGTQKALVVCSRDGLDEVSLSAPTLVREVRGGSVVAYEWTAEDFGLEPCALEALRVDGPQASAALLRSVVGGERGPAMRVVLANAAAALLVMGKVTQLGEGVRLAQDAIVSRRALRVLEQSVHII